MNVEHQDLNNAEQYQYRNMHDSCENFMHHHVLLNHQDGSSFDGIIVNVDLSNVTVLVGEDMLEDDAENNRYGSYGYGHPSRRYRRYRPRRFPLASLAALSLLPYVSPVYPGYYPYPYW
ncbi:MULTISPECIES: hypothetical protein [Paraliobacillus]|uniref:hypothetical protein n=1 Tax=Paraliobacillus TaxID=200903 RepID=UPI0018E566D4|nr:MULTISPECIES: hypothetical protein [Paraliobacillus]